MQRGLRKLLSAAALLLGVCTAGVGCHSMPAPSPVAEPPLAAGATPQPVAAAYTLEPRVALVWRIESAATGQEVMVGQSQVGPDGTLVLGPYGSVPVAGLTVDQARSQVEQHLTAYVQQPRVVLNMSAYSGVPAGAPATAVAAASPPPAPARLPTQAAPTLATAPVVHPAAPQAAPRPTVVAAAVRPPVRPSASPYGRMPQPVLAAKPPAVKPTEGVIEIATAPSAPAGGATIIRTAAWQPVPTDPTPAAPTVCEFRPRSTAPVAPPQGSQWNGLQHGTASGLVTVSWQGESPGLVAPPPTMTASVEPLAEPITTLPRPLPSTAQAPPPPATVGEPPLTSMPYAEAPPPHPMTPHECARVSLPPYVIDPPDILLIEASPALPDQTVGGSHLVRPDGSVSLGIYGSVYVAGMTLDGAREAIRAQLALRAKAFNQSMDKVNLSVDVLAYNSKFYYVIADGGGLGQQISRHSITGNETVLDAMTFVGGLNPVSSKHKIWLARPCGQDGHPHLYPVDWRAVTMCGGPNTNYQLMPGDRVYVDSQGLVKLDTALARFFSPVERALGIVLLGSSTVNSIKEGGQNGGFGR